MNTSESYKITITDQAEKDLEEFQADSPEEYKKVQVLLSELMADPFEGDGKMEALKHDLTGYFSRRVNHKDRLVYHVDNVKKVVTVVSVRGHYDDH